MFERLFTLAFGFLALIFLFRMFWRCRKWLQKFQR